MYAKWRIFVCQVATFAGVGVREGVGHQGGAKRRPRSGRMGVERGQIVRPGVKPLWGRSFPGLSKNQVLLYVAPKLSASAIAAYTHDV
jgi:hypothetical protein